MDVNDINAQIAALEAARKQAIADANVSAKAARDTIPLEFDWRVDWKDNYSLVIECRHTAECEAALRAWKAEYPLSTITMPEFKWHGMRHILVGNVLVTAWGGSIILSIPRPLAKDYHELTAEQAASLRAGIVPMELRKPW